MSLDEKALALVRQVGADVQGLKASLGNLDDLQTTNKESLSAALQELEEEFQNKLSGTQLIEP